MRKYIFETFAHRIRKIKKHNSVIIVAVVIIIIIIYFSRAAEKSRRVVEGVEGSHGWFVRCGCETSWWPCSSSSKCIPEDSGYQYVQDSDADHIGVDVVRCRQEAGDDDWFLQEKIKSGFLSRPGNTILLACSRHLFTTCKLYTCANCQQICVTRLLWRALTRIGLLLGILHAQSLPLSVQFSSVQYEYLYSTIKQDVAVRPGSNIKTNTS